VRVLITMTEYLGNCGGVVMPTRNVPQVVKGPVPLPSYQLGIFCWQSIDRRSITHRDCFEQWALDNNLTKLIATVSEVKGHLLYDLCSLVISQVYLVHLLTLNQNSYKYAETSGVDRTENIAKRAE